MKEMCFATLAIGKEYRELAKMMINDLLAFDKTVEVIIFTDKPNEFRVYQNVIAYHLVPSGAWYCYHEKRHPIHMAMKNYRVCVFLDADSRLLNPPPIKKIKTLSAGIYGRGVVSLHNKMNYEESLNKSPRRILKNTPSRRRKLLVNFANHIGVKYEDVLFIDESVMIFVSSDDVNLTRFFSIWDYAASYMTVRGYEWGEGEIIGLAASAIAWPVLELPGISRWLFKDLYCSDMSLDNMNDELVEKFLHDRAELAKRFEVNLMKKLHRYFRGGIGYIRNVTKWVFAHKKMKRSAVKQ